MILSRSFDTIDKLEIGLYDLVSVESMPAFWRIGVMKAELYTLGNVPADSDRQYNSARKGATTAATRF